MNLIDKKILCPVCDYKSSYYKKLKEVTLYICVNCKHRFTDIESIRNKETYTLEYFKEKHPNWFKNQNLELFDYIFNIIKSNTDPFDILSKRLPMAPPRINIYPSNSIFINLLKSFIKR